MSKIILVPLDGSALAERALPYAAALARASEGQLLLLRASRAEAEDTYGYLEGLAKKVRAEGVFATTEVSYISYWEEAARAIRETAREKGADLVVLSTHGRGGLGRWLYGSVADTVVREAEVPLLLIPAVFRPAWRTDRPLRVLVPLDGSPLGEQVLAPAAALAELLGAEVHLLRVIVPFNYMAAGMYVGTMAYLSDNLEDEAAEARRYLEHIAAGLRTAGRTVQTWTATGQPGATIELVGREQDVDLIAMATHGHGGLARLLLGSVATGTLERARVPLLLVRPSDQAQADLASPRPVAAVEPAPEPQPTVPTVTLALTTTELALLHRGLGELIYTPGRDLRLAEPARALMARLKAAEPNAAGGPA